MNNLKRLIVLFLLIVGVTVGVNGENIVVSYKVGNSIRKSTVSRYHSACIPQIGQRVFFYKSYKIVECIDESI